MANMFFTVTTILLVSIEYLFAAENSTIVQTLQLPEALSTSFGNTTTRESEATEVQVASNYVTENLLVIPNTSDQLQHQESRNIEQKQNDYNFLRPRGKTKFIFENIVHASTTNSEAQRNKTKTQDQSDYSFDQQLGDLQRQQLQIATVEKEEFIQSELHNLAKDIAETELNFEAGKTDTNPRPSSWKSFFSSIFPQGILNVFHLSVSAEPQKSKELPRVQVNRNPTYQNKRMITERSTFPITPPMTPPLPIAPPLSETPPSIPIAESPSITPETVDNKENQNGTVMTNKDVFDINSAAEVSELPFEAVVPMESRNIFHIHPANCEDNCGVESEDYVDQLSETGEDNVVAFSREAPKNLFYPTPHPYGDLNSIPNADIFYSGTGSQTSEEIIRENTKDFGQKLPYHPAKQLDDFQKEVEKQFDHNEVRIDSEAASRTFLKHFKGKYVKPPQQSNSDIQFPTQSSTFKGAVNHYELVSSTLRPEINFQSQSSPIKPESQLHTYIYSAGFKSDSAKTGPSKLEAAGSWPRYTTLKEQPRNGKADNENQSQGQIIEEKSPNSENLSVPYPNVKPQQNLLRAYIFSSALDNNNSVSSAESGGPPKPGAIVASWIAPNKNSDTKESAKLIPNQINNAGNGLHTNIYSADLFDNANSVQGEIRDGQSLKSDKTYQVHSTSLKPESLLHTYIFSAQDKNNNSNSVSNAESGGTRQEEPEAVFSSWSSPKPVQYGHGLSSFRPTQTTYLCTNDQLKNGDCSYSTTPPPDSFYQKKDLVEIQKSLEGQVKHNKPYVYYNFPAGQPLLSKNPIRVAQPEDSQQSETYIIPESYQQRQQYLQDHQKQLNQQQDHFQQQQILQYQQKLQYQQQLQYQQKQREQMQKQQEQLQQYQQKQQQQMQQYQQVQQQERDQQQQQLQKQQLQQEQHVQQFQQLQQQQRDQQHLQKQQQQLQQYQQEQKIQRDQQQLLQKQNDLQQKHQQEHQQQYEKQQKLVRYNTVKVEKLVPKPYPVPVKEIVEKIVEYPVPVERIVEKPVNVPYPVREVVEKIVDRPYPVEKIIDRPVHIPYPVQVDHFIDRPYAVRVPVAVAVPVPVHQYIDRPYPVEKIIEKPIHVPYPVDKVVEKIIEKHIPIEVERIVERPAPKKAATKKSIPTSESHASSAVDAAATAATNKSKINLEELLELVPPPADQGDHESYKTIPDDIEFILLDDYNRPVPLDHQGYPWSKPEKRAVKNHNIKRSPEFRRNLRVEYGFRPPLIPSIEIGEKGLVHN